MSERTLQEGDLLISEDLSVFSRAVYRVRCGKANLLVNDTGG
jgi:hypothetical protein